MSTPVVDLDDLSLIEFRRRIRSQLLHLTLVVTILNSLVHTVVLSWLQSVRISLGVSGDVDWLQIVVLDNLCNILDLDLSFLVTDKEQELASLFVVV